MTKSEILSHVDHTCLSPTATYADIEKTYRDAIEQKTAAVCIPPYYVKDFASKYYDQIATCTVVGFPLGYSTLNTKVIEATQALESRASEIDVVINLAALKNGELWRISTDLEILSTFCRSYEAILKVIVETCYLTEKEKIELCQIVSQSGANYIKTSTGFGPQGAVLRDIELFKKHLQPHVKIKAAGGISTFADAEAFLNAGADRIGSSRLATRSHDNANQ